MVLYCIRVTMSHHHCYGRTYSISCTLPIRALVPCSQEQWKLFGQLSPQLFMLDEIAVPTTMVMHLPNHTRHHTPFKSRNTLFNVFVPISSIIKVSNTLLLLIAIRTGLWDPWWTCFWWRTWICCYCLLHLFEKLGGQSLPIFSGLSPFKIQGRYRCQDNKKNDRIKYRASRHLDTDALQRTMLQYHNIPDPQTWLSPAMGLFVRPIKDFIPILPVRYEPYPNG